MATNGAPFSLRATIAATRRSWRKRWHSLRDFARVARRYSRFVSDHRSSLALAFLCSIGYVATGLLQPWPIKLVFDSVLFDLPLPGWLRPLTARVGDDRMTLLYTLVASIVAIALARGVLYSYRSLLTAMVGQRTVADIRLELFGHVQRLSFSFHDRRRTGDVLARLTSDIRVLRSILIALPLTVATELLLIAGMIVVMFVMDWRLTLVSLLVVPGLAIPVRLYQKPLRKAIRKQREREGTLASMSAEILGAIKVVQGFTREEDELDRFRSQNRRSLSSGLKAARLEAQLNRSVEIVVATITALVILLAVKRVLAGYLSPGDLLVFIAYLRNFYRPLRRISRTVERAARGAASGERVLEMLAIRPTVRDRSGAVAAGHLTGRIEFDDVSFAYRRKNGANLDGVSLTIETGERLALVGPSGAGKTTLVSLIPRFYDPDAGRVLLDGVDARDLTLNSIRQQIGIVFQEPVLFATTIAENIGHGKPDATPEEIVRASELAGIGGIIARLDDGYDTVIGERGGTLSGGERQCVAIARAIIRDPSIVILDEPTTGLDGPAAAMVMNALGRLMEDRTVIIISHQLRSVQDADRVVVLDGGRIVEQGDHEELLRNGGLYHALHSHQPGSIQV